MARIGKQGLDYFPQNVDFLQERVIRRLIRKHGTVAALMVLALKSYIYGEKGYYMEWNEDVCFDLSEMVNTEMEKVHAVIADAINEEIFCRQQFKENRILTSAEIQKQYLACTQKRKNVVIEEKYRIGINAPQNLFSEEEMQKEGEETRKKEAEYNKVKEIESKEKEKKTTLTPPPGESGSTGPEPEQGDSPTGEEGGKDLVLVLGRKVPRYCLNKQTHNYDGLLDRLTQIHITDVKAANTIIQKCDYGRIGHPLWGIISHRNWPTYGIKFPAKYLLSQIKLLE